MAAATITKQFS